MLLGSADLAVIFVGLFTVLAGVLAAVLAFVILYFVVRKAVFDALRKYDEYKFRSASAR